MEPGVSPRGQRTDVAVCATAWLPTRAGKNVKATAPPSCLFLPPFREARSASQSPRSQCPSRWATELRGGIAWMPEGWVGQAGGHKDRQWTDGRTDELAELHEEAFHRGAEGAG